MVAVDTGDPRERVEAMVREAGIGYRVLLDDGRAAKAYGIVSSPTCVLVRGGRVVYRGEEPPEELR